MGLVPSTAQVLASLAVALGIAGLIVDALQIMPPSALLISPLEATCLCLAGSAVFMARYSARVPRTLAHVLAAAAGFVAVRGALVPDGWSGPLAGGVTPATALGYVAVSAGVLLMGQRAVRLATVGLMVVAIVVVGHILNIGSMVGRAFDSQIPVPSSLGLLLLFVALLAANPHTGWVRLVSAPTVHSRATRNLLLWVLLAPLVIAWIATAGSDLGLLDSRLKLPLVTVATMVCLAVLVLSNASRARLLDRQRRLADAATRLSEERLRLTTTATGVGIWDLNLESGAIYWSSEARAIFGFGRHEEISRDAVMQRIHPDDLLQASTAIRSLAGGENSFTVEHRLRDPGPDGETVWVSVNGSAVRRGGRLVRVVGTILDVSARRKVRLALEESERRLQLATEALQGYVYDVDRLTGHVTRSPGFNAIFGYRPGDLATGMDAWLELIHPDDRHVAESARTAAFETDARSHSCEYRVRHRDGHYLWIWDHTIFVRDAAGQTTRMVGNVIDITARKSAEERFQDATRRLELAIDAASIGMWDWDLATNDVNWSPKCFEITGRSRERGPPTRHEFQAMLHADDAAAVQAGVRKAIAERGTFEIEFRFIRADGSVRWAQNRAGVVVDEQGKPVRVVGTLLDVTAAKEVAANREAMLLAERAARTETDRVAQLKDEFLAMVSHELRTPLNAMMGWLLLLKKPMADPKRLAEGLQVIERNVRLQAQLITDLFDVNRLMSGKLSLELQPVDINEVVRDTVNSVLPSAQEKHVEIRVELGRGSIIVEGDSRRLQQVISNLLTNAIKFTPADGHIAVSTDTRDGRCLIVVEDTGEGIAPDLLPYIFERFRQGDGSRTRRHGGLGLGLAITNQLVALHGGQVTATSDGVGRGARFEVSLPILLADRGRLRATVARLGPEPAALTPDSLAGLRILVVDDQPDAVEYLGRVLEEQGALVRRARSASEALAAIRDSDEGFDILISDIGMPDTSGYDLIRRVRGDFGLDATRLPAIAVTAFARDEDQQRSLDAGFQQHVAKPIQVVELIAAIQAVADGAGRRRPSKAGGER